MAIDQRIDYRGIRERVNVQSVFEWLGLDMRPYGTTGQLRGPCPMCNSRSANSLVYTISKESWCCQGRCEPRRGKKVAGGDIIDLVARIRDISNPDAAMLLDREFLGNSNTAMPRREQLSTANPASRRASVPDRRTQEDRQERQNDSPAGMQPLDHLDAEHEALAELGLSAEDAEIIGAGYAKVGVLKGLVAFPLRTEDGVLLGYVGVAEGRMGKLHIPKQNVVPFNKKRALEVAPCICRINVVGKSSRKLFCAADIPA
jgi:DNA primase